MEYDDLLLEKKGPIGIITLNAPQKMNAITLKMRKSIVLAANDVAEDDEIRVVIVTGAGKAYCAGGDIQAFKGRLDKTMDWTRYSRIRKVGYWATAFPGIDKPVIAAINGACLGAGFALALSCDIRIASENAKFASSYILRGFIPDSGMSYFLPHAVGTSKALELMFTGRTFDAAEAERLGFLSRVVPNERLMDAAMEMANQIAQQPPVAVELTKRIVYRSIVDDIQRHLDWETSGMELCWQTKDVRESVNAFLEKRPHSEYKGKFE